MKIGKIITWNNCEFKIQDIFEEWLKNKSIKYLREYSVSDIHRRADFLLFKIGQGLINVEAKYKDFHCLLRQMKDHATYCRYCFALIPDTVLTPIHFKNELIRNGFGLIVYNCEKEIITEVLEANYNKPKNKELQEKISNIIRNKDR